MSLSRRGVMSPVVAERLEKQLEDTGTLHLSRDKAKALFDYRARKLVNMSGKDALKRIRGGKYRLNGAWMELASFASLFQ
jgi:hypothetical protein